MRFLQFLTLALSVVGVVAQATDEPATEDLTESEITTMSNTKIERFGDTFGSTCGCVLLSVFAQTEVFWPGSGPYVTETTTRYWSATTWSSPRCVFVPESPKSVSKGIIIAKLCKSQFAIRGGGHMPIPGFTGTSEEGILFSLSALNELSLSSDKSSVFVGPGKKWGQVYTFLVPHGRYVMGGRIDSVGVPGLILGGGLNFFSNKYGFAMDNVKSYKCVLASGRVVTVTASNEYQDLFWGLHGGSSNFCIVTKFELKTYPITSMWGGIGVFTGENNYNTFYHAIANYTNSGYTAYGAGLVSLINWAPGQENIGIHCAAHESLGTNSTPPIFSSFQGLQDLPGASFGLRKDTFELSGPDWLGNPALIQGNRHGFRIHSSKASFAALRILHETFYSEVQTLQAKVPSILSSAVAIQGVPSTLLQRAAYNGVGSNALGISQDDNYLWYNINTNWVNPADDAAARAWAKTLGGKLSAAFQAAGLTGNGGREFLYLNDADGDQDCFASYGPTELARLKTVRDKYDPDGKVFGKNGLSKGGFKF